MKKYRHLFFDLDGTLWDLQRNTRIALEMLFTEFSDELSGVPFDNFYKRYHHHNDRVWTLYRQGKIEKNDLRISRFVEAFNDCGLKPELQRISIFSEAFSDYCPHQPHTLEGAIELLEYCYGNYQVHIITNGFQEIQGHKMKAAKLERYFKHVINSDHCGVRKPGAGIFRYALDQAGAQLKESLMIGDDWEADILGARDFGMDQAFLTTTDRMMAEIHGQSKPVRHNYTPTFTIDSLTELKAYL